MYKQFIIITFVFALTGCTTLGSSYKQVENTLQDYPASKARIIILRTHEHQLYSGRSAPIKIDNREASSCPMGGFDFFDISPEPHELTTETWDYPGKCGFKIMPKAGEIYYFEVIPRESSFNPWFMVGMLGGAIGGVISGSISANLDKDEKDCRGMFALVPLNEEEAKNKILELNIVVK